MIGDTKSVATLTSSLCLCWVECRMWSIHDVKLLSGHICKYTKVDCTLHPHSHIRPHTQSIHWIKLTPWLLSHWTSFPNNEHEHWNNECQQEKISCASKFFLVTFRPRSSCSCYNSAELPCQHTATAGRMILTFEITK